MSHKVIVAATATLLLPLALAAQAPPPRAVALAPVVAARPLPLDRGAAAVWQSLEKLHTRASLLLILAHPDDEDGGMMTMESRGAGARVALLTLNRGEGGENLMSNDFYDALGLVRTQELLAADRYYGVQQYFTRVVDFGFSKTEAETLQQWGHQRLLEDVVRVVRETRPLVLASVFVGGPSDGHGNHAASGEITQEVYNAAADPKVFPDQIQAGLLPWTPLKVYARDPIHAFTPRGIYDSASQVYTPGRIYDYVHQRWIEGPPSVTLNIEEGSFDPLLGQSYLQIARQGLALQRTQLSGLGVPDLGPSSTPYHLYASRVPTGDKENSYFDGVDTSLAGIADLAPGPQGAFLRPALLQINTQVESAMKAFNAAAPDTIAPQLARGLAATDALLTRVASSSLDAAAKYNVTYELKIKQAQFNDALAQALGLAFTARVSSGGRDARGGPGVSFSVAIPGQQFSVEARIANPSAQPVAVESMELRNPPGDPAWPVQRGAAQPGSIAREQAASQTFSVTVPQDAAYTRPYYSRPNTEQAYYNLDDPRYVTLPTSPYPLSAWVHLRFQGVPFELAQVVQTVTRPAASEIVENPLVVAPAISVAIAPRAGVIPLGDSQLALTVNLHSNVKGPAQGTVELRLPAGWTATPTAAAFAMRQDGQEEPVAFTIHPAALSAQSYTITAVAHYGGRVYEEGYHTAGYAGLRPYNLYSPATYLARGVDVKIAPHLNVAYVAGTGDSVPQSLVDLGVHVHDLTAADLATGDLQAYSAIVLGIRAYAARADLRTYNPRLLQYVHDGGVLIVQYQTSEFDHDFGPYPYHLGGSGATVVDETAPVEILQPANPVLSWPNPITTADFAGWVEERGHGFMASWDSHYLPLVSTHDPDQPAQLGGLLYAPYGKGVYVYEGLALYRQLAEAVPGAYRLFANLLSLSQRPTP